MNRFRKNSIKILSVVGAVSFFLGNCIATAEKAITSENSGISENSPYTSLSNRNIKTNQEDYYDSSVIYKLPESISQNEEVSVIVTMSTETVMDAYGKADSDQTLSEYVNSKQAKKLSSKIENEQNVMIKRLNKAGIDYVLGERYDTILNGFEITIKAKDFEKVQDLFKSDAALIVGEEYERCDTQVVNNEVEVYETGIFDSSTSKYQGDGVVVAVLDTGLDYTHTAFSVDNFKALPEDDAFTLANVSEKVGQTVAASYTSGLTGEDVYYSRKVPYTYDYADKDPDVLPINSEHGTHVAGVIAGNDDTITGVAPNAQLAIMKVFSDTATGAKTSWILSALEDCVTLGVDVINMSLGSSCGFSREVDEEKVNKIYDSIREAGISLICAASNDYNATHGSEKNGSLGLTSNPDSGTVGSPSTYAAALSVASVDGVKTPYLLYKGQIIYFNEASTSSAKTKDFVDDILSTVGTDVQSHDFEYVTIPGIGRSSDYPQDADFYKGKIVLVKRGTTTFEDKVRVALKEKGAAGIIIYNNVSGTISMSVGKDVGAVCSIGQDEGELLATAGTGTITISRENVAGPFMSEFSSWGPTSDLKIKPEITAHGGEILSAVPGQGYDRLSGTSMASPNQAGATALIRQYVKNSDDFGANKSAVEVTSLVNRLMMSTADIIYNKNGLPYAVRKQGSGLVNITKAYTSASYITTFDENGNAMDKTKLELGDDKEKTGVYEMSFAINNISDSAVSYNVDSIIMTEGVSKTYTSHSETTVTQDGYLLSGTKTTVTKVGENGSQNGNTVTVKANSTATVSVKIVLSDADKKYMDEAFEHGMYVEGFITLEATSGTTVNMNVPMLTFYGDWTEAPIFDEEYYDTNVDEINAGLDTEDKLMADAYATRVIGGLYTDYIATLGSYYFTQDPSATQIAASKEHIAISNQTGTKNATINSLRYIYAGLLRNVKQADISIVEDATGKVIFSTTEYNQRKSHSSGSTIYASPIDVEFSALENNLKNNTQYTVTCTAYIDYGENEAQNNVRNTFTFPLYIDFEAPIVTDVTYRTEYDKTTRKTQLFADLNVYDNHYAMGVQIGQVVPSDYATTGYYFSMNTFGKYVTPVYSSFNSTSTVTIELTDYVAQLKESAGINYDEEGKFSVEKNNNSFIAICYDYAMNSATYEIRLPDDILSIYFTEEEVNLSPNETKAISDILEVFPAESWLQVLDFTTSNPEVVDIVNQTMIAKKSGTATITAIGYDAEGNKVTAVKEVTVLDEDKGYSIPEVNKFTITGYKTNKAYYSVVNEDRDIGLTDGVYDFDGVYTLTMFPSESVTLKYSLDSYFPDRTGVTYTSGNSKIATIDETGTIIAQAEGSTVINVNVTFDGKMTLYSGRVSITVKDPFTTNSIYLMSYKGLGGEVIIPDDRGITTIYSYAFCNYEYVDKDLDAGDVIDEEDPYYIKQWFIGDDTITKVVIPEGVESIESYAFANLTALEEVVLPSTLTKIGLGAFYGCKNLKKINLNNVKFVNEKAFYGCGLENQAEYEDENGLFMDSMVAIGNYAFAGCKFNYLVLPQTAQSLGEGAFYDNEYLSDVTFDAPKVKIGSYAFAKCPLLTAVDINAAVISTYAFQDCKALSQVKFGKDVSVIGEFAFAGTSVPKFELDKNNTVLSLKENGVFVYRGEELVLVAPTYAGVANKAVIDATYIATGAFSGNTKIFYVEANNVKTIGAYAFAGCTNLQEVTIAKVEEIGDYAFSETNLKKAPNLDNVKVIGDYAFADTAIEELTIGSGAVIGKYTFASCKKLTKVTLGDNVTVGEGAFYCPVSVYTYEKTGSLDGYKNYYVYEVKDEDGNVVETYHYYGYDFKLGVISTLKSLTIGNNVKLEKYAFAGNAYLTDLTFGEGANIGDYAFFNAAELKDVDLSEAVSIGAYAFSGTNTQDLRMVDNEYQYAYEREYVDGEIVIIGYKYSYFAPQFKKADLSSATYIGEGAFASNAVLEEVVLGDNVTAISDFAFAYCNALSDIELTNKITSLGKYAFYGTKLTGADLSNVSVVGAYSFAKTGLTTVSLKNDAIIEDGAFAYCEELATVNNLQNVSSIGAYAFASTAIEKAVLTNVTKIGDFAFGQSQLTAVEFGEKLTELGENPFYGCNIATFGKEDVVIFNNKEIGKQLIKTYDISETVKVIDEVLYQIVPNGGMELVSYPMAKEDRSYVVEEGTVRVTARAFQGAALENVTLATTVKALGDKAFYDCQNLSVVVFKSYYAPILEEEYDISYLTYENLPYTGRIVANETTFEGLGISQYYMWNATSSNNFYFGANFVDYIGHVSDSLVMVKPVNGQNYDTFIFSQYFGTKVEGSTAATEATLNVIELINTLPDNIKLSDEALILAVRDAYDKIPTKDQQALVNNYSKLTSAESTLEYLKLKDEENNNDNPGGDSSSSSEDPGSNVSGCNGCNSVVGSACAGVMLVLTAGFVLSKKKKDNK